MDTNDRISFPTENSNIEHGMDTGHFETVWWNTSYMLCGQYYRQHNRLKDQIKQNILYEHHADGHE